jgi:hypothetical protein
MAEQSDSRFNRAKKDIGAIVAISLIAVAFTQGVLDGFIAAAEHSNLTPGAEDYVEFASLYLSTFFLSATLTATVAVFAIPTMIYKQQVPWYVPCFVLATGAILTGLPVNSPGGGPLGWAFAALSSFAAFYGTAFWGGLIVGAAGGLILFVIVNHFGSEAS